MAFFCGFIYNSILKTNNKFLEKILMKTRKIILKFYNPIITITYNDFTLSMPFSHTIFINQKHFPSYDMQLHKIAQAIIAGGGD